MSRDIQFRGKRVDNGELVHGYYLKWNSKSWIYPGNRGATFPIGPEAIEVIPETVGQYTGLKDKNGKEIYGGDIVQLNELENGKKCEVWWNKKESRFAYGDKSFPIHCYTCTVVGNIHENPELLKG